MSSVLIYDIDLELLSNNIREYNIKILKIKKEKNFSILEGGKIPTLQTKQSLPVHIFQIK